jgi:hypothetical protein
VRAINHALTGTLIGLAVGQPVIAVPVALASHYVCDVIPHYGASLSKLDEMKSSLFKRLLYVDALLCFGLVVLLALFQPPDWQLAAICAFVAASPDFASLGKFMSANAHKPLKSNAYIKFADRIQWFERPIGAIVEVIWAVAMIALIMPFID